MIALEKEDGDVAADANTAGQMYPDQSLYPVNSVPKVVGQINGALQRADQIDRAEGQSGRYWYAPIVADAEAGFGGPLNAFELMKAMIETVDTRSDIWSRERQGSISKTSSPPRKNAATWAARFWFPRASSSGFWSPRGSPPT